MNVVHLTPYYAPAYAFGGVTRAVEGMARALVARGHAVTVLTTDALNQNERYDGAFDVMQDGVHVVRVRNLSAWLRGRLNLSTPLGIHRAARDLLASADVLHCHEFRTTENLLVTPIAADRGVPLLLSPHGTLTLATGRGALKAGWDRLLSPSLARRFSVVVGLTDAETADARAAWHSFGIAQMPRFEVVPNGVDAGEFADLANAGEEADAFRARWNLGDAPICLYLGRLHPRKGADVLLEAFKQADVDGARLVIAGPDEGLMSALRDAADERVILTGYLGSAERLAALAAADVFCLPATGEGLSMALLEALAAGLPAIISPGCNLPEAAAVGAALIVEPRVEPLASALRDLLTDMPRRRAMGVAAQSLIQDHFTWSAAAKRLEAVYQQVLR